MKKLICFLGISALIGCSNHAVSPNTSKKEQFMAFATCSSVEECKVALKSVVEKSWRKSCEHFKGIEATVFVKLNEQNKIIQAEISNSSGDEYFDVNALRAVIHARSFPELSGLDKETRKKYFTTFTFQFNPDCPSP